MIKEYIFFSFAFPLLQYIVASLPYCRVQFPEGLAAIAEVLFPPQPCQAFIYPVPKVLDGSSVAATLGSKRPLWGMRHTLAGYETRYGC
jgi:hypothetical protein